MRRLPTTILLALAFLGYAAALGSNQAWHDLRSLVDRAGESVIAVVGAALVGFVAGGRGGGEGSGYANLDRLLLTVLAVVLLWVAWADGPGTLSRKEPTCHGLELTGGDGQCGSAGEYLPQGLSVRAVRRDGGGVAGVAVSYRVVEGDGRLLFADRTTRDDGTCETWFRLADDAGPCRVAAYPVDRPELAVTFDLAARPATA